MLGAESLGLSLSLRTLAHVTLAEPRSSLGLCSRAPVPLVWSRWPRGVQPAPEPQWFQRGQLHPALGDSLRVTSEVRAVSEYLLLFQHKVTFDPTSSYTLEDLKPDTLYHFQLAARSEMGVGVFTPTIEARTAQSSKCLLSLLRAAAGLGHTHTPSPLARQAARSAGPWTGLWSGPQVWTQKEGQVSALWSASRQRPHSLLPA